MTTGSSEALSAISCSIPSSTPSVTACWWNRSSIEYPDRPSSGNTTSAARDSDAARASATVRSVLMAGSAICYVLIAFRPQIALLLPVALVFFAGWGAYQAMDWALALKVLPKSEAAGKDMGIWHVALVLPQILGPAATGWIITGAKIAVSARFAYTVAFGIAAVWFILSAALIGRVRLARTV